MDDIIFSNQAAIRLGSFFFVLVGMAVWETVAPRRERQLTRRTRRTTSVHPKSRFVVDAPGGGGKRGVH